MLTKGKLRGDNIVKERKISHQDWLVGLRTLHIIKEIIIVAHSSVFGSESLIPLAPSMLKVHL